MTSTEKKKSDKQTSGVYPGKVESRKHYHCQSQRSNDREYILIEISKTGNDRSIKWKRCSYVVTYCLEEIVDIPSVAFYCQSRDISPIGNKVPDLDFYGSVNHEFYTRLGIWNCKSVWSTDKFLKKLMLLRKKESSLKKKVSRKDFCSSELKSSKKKETLQNERSDDKFHY